MRKRTSQDGVTLAELLTVLAIFFILSVIAYPNVAAMRTRMRASEDARSVLLVMGELRAEAIRLRQPVRVTFTATGLNWDIGNDGSVEGTYTFNTGTSWRILPTAQTINGYGLIRGIPGGAVALTVQNGSVTFGLSINSNGHMELT